MYVRVAIYDKVTEHHVRSYSVGEDLTKPLLQAAHVPYDHHVSGGDWPIAEIRVPHVAGMLGFQPNEAYDYYIEIYE